MKAWRLSAVVLALVLLLGTALPALAQDGAPIKPGGPFVPPNANNNGSALMTFADVEKELLALQARSKGVMKLDIAGYTLEGRPLYIAKLGQGRRGCGSRAVSTAMSRWATTCASRSSRAC